LHVHEVGKGIPAVLAQLTTAVIVFTVGTHGGLGRGVQGRGTEERGGVIYLQGVPGLSWLSLLTAAAIVFAALSIAAVGVDERLLDDVLEPLPDFFFLFLSPSNITKAIRQYSGNWLMGPVDYFRDFRAPVLQERVRNIQKFGDVNLMFRGERSIKISLC